MALALATSTSRIGILPASVTAASASPRRPRRRRGSRGFREFREFRLVPRRFHLVPRGFRLRLRVFDLVTAARDVFDEFSLGDVRRERLVVDEVVVRPVFLAVRRRRAVV